MVSIINYNCIYLKELYKLYCMAHNITINYDYCQIDDSFLSNINAINIKLLKINSKIRGYILSSIPYSSYNNNRININEVYIEKKYNSWVNYMNLIEATNKKSLFKHYIYAQLYIQSKSKNTEIITKLDLHLDKKMFEMQIHLYENKKINISNNINFVMFRNGLDEQKRIVIQNSIFKETKEHRECTLDDILFDEKQDYYLEDGSIFLSINNNIIGYSQIILEKNPDTKPYIVNFGIDINYRGMGLSKQLLNYTLNKIKQLGFNHAYITVDSENHKAHNLYKNMGFEKFSAFSCYLYKYKL